MWQVALHQLRDQVHGQRSTAQLERIAACGDQRGRALGIKPLTCSSGTADCKAGRQVDRVQKTGTRLARTLASAQLVAYGPLARAAAVAAGAGAGHWTPTMPHDYQRDAATDSTLSTRVAVRSENGHSRIG